MADSKLVKFTQHRCDLVKLPSQYKQRHYERLAAVVNTVQQQQAVAVVKSAADERT